jgi:SAM-dependent methyltransferase
MSTTDAIYSSVREHYSSAALAQYDDTNRSYSEKVASAFGYSASELQHVPDGANLGLSCGNPTALAGLKEGETVIDLGSGAGFDVFLAAKKVGETGKVFGVDMNEDMLSKARSIAAKTNATNVLFVHAQITSIPEVPGATADWIISNCVSTLVPEDEKQKVFDEMFRLLKPGGRVAVSDILARNEMPPDVANDMALYVGCIAGASQVAQYEGYLRKAGFKDVLITDTKSDLNVYKTAAAGADAACCAPPSTAKASCCSPPTTTQASCCSPPSTSVKSVSNGTPKDMDYNEFAGSFKIYALKS